MFHSLRTPKYPPVSQQLMRSLKDAVAGDNDLRALLLHLRGAGPLLTLTSLPEFETHGRSYIPDRLSSSNSTNKSSHANSWFPKALNCSSAV